MASRELDREHIVWIKERNIAEILAVNKHLWLSIFEQMDRMWLHEVYVFPVYKKNVLSAHAVWAAVSDITHVITPDKSS